MRGRQQSNGGSEAVAFPATNRFWTDGGERNDEESESTNESAENETEETSDESEAEDESTENETEDESTENGGESDGTTVLYLDLEGLFLNLLGLEVDLDEVELDVSAVPNSGALLGNLLSGVAGLFDKGPLGRLEDRLSGFELPSPADLVPNDGGSVISETFYRMVNELLDVLTEILTEEESTEESGS